MKISSAIKGLSLLAVSVVAISAADARPRYYHHHHHYMHHRHWHHR